MVPPFKKLNTPDQNLNRVQDALQSAFAQLAAEPLSDAIIIPAHLVAGQPNIVPGGLGRKVQGYAVVSKDANANVWNGLIGVNMVLYTDVDVTVSLLVF